MDKKNNTKNDIQLEKNDIAKKAAELNIAYLSKAPKIISSEIIKIIPEEVAKEYGMVVFELAGRNMNVAMLNPQDINALNTLRFIAEKEKREAAIYLVDKQMFDGLLHFYAGPSNIVQEAVKSFESEKGSLEIVEDKKESAEQALKEAPVAKLVEVIVSHAIDGHASDIHIEPMERDFRVRFRVDGVLHVSLIIPKEIGPVVVSRIKILSNLKIDEKRKPQDGRFRLIHSGSPIDFRVSTLPVINGEKVVMRILDKDKGVSDIETMGLVGTGLSSMKEAIKETYGMILMTGPTGSGKSTSLYAMLKILNNEERNIITLEDPIEYDIEGLNQSQIKPEIGYTFASGLRTILRQDPNVIMVGEIRDAETAELAVHAALTGHLMFSTLHTNTAIGAVPRLIDMGIEPFLLSSSLRLVIAQRLVRKICENCKAEAKISEVLKKQIADEVRNIPKKELDAYGVDLSGKISLFHGKGCDACNGTGLVGRVAIFEVVRITDAMRNIIIEKRGNEILLSQERDKMGFLTIRQDGLLKVLKGMTTFEEIERVTESNISLEEEND